MQLYKALVLPVLEYGSEVWGNCEWEEAELLQRAVARRILGAKQSTSIPFLMGELGWWPLAARRDLLRLKFWWRLVNMPMTRGVKIAYQYCKSKFQASMASGRNLGRLKKHSMNWCEYTFSLLKELQLENVFWSEDVGTAEEWKRLIFGKIQAREEQKWKTEMAGNVKLELYRQVKSKLKFELYLLDERSNAGRIEFGRFRSGSSNLRIDKGREIGLARDKRVCLLCMLAVEDVEHVMLVCPAYGQERSLLWAAIDRATGLQMDALPVREKMVLLFDTGSQWFRAVYRPVRSFLIGVRKLRAMANI